MGAVPPVKRLVRDDFPELAKAVGDDTDKLFQTLNDFLQPASQALSKGLTFGDNFAAQIKELVVDHQYPQLFKSTVSGVPVGLWCVNAAEVASSPVPLAFPLGIDWEMSGDNVKINYISGLAASKKYRLTIIVVGGGAGARQATRTAPSPTPEAKLFTVGDAWTEIGASGAPAFENSWENYDSTTYATAAYMRDHLGFVHLKGEIKTGTVGATVFTLPEQYRPALKSSFATASNGAFGSIDVGSDGKVTAAVGSNVSMSLNPVLFRAEQ